MKKLIAGLGLIAALALTACAPEGATTHTGYPASLNASAPASQVMTEHQPQIDMAKTCPCHKDKGGKMDCSCCKGANKDGKMADGSMCCCHKEGMCPRPDGKKPTAKPAAKAAPKAAVKSSSSSSSSTSGSGKPGTESGNKPVDEGKK